MNFLKKLLEATFKNVQSDSKSGKINSTDLVKMLRTACLVGLGGSIAFLLANISGVDLGNESLNIIFTTVAVAGLEFAQRLIKDNTKETEEK